LYLVLGVLETFYTIAGGSCYKFMTKVCNRHCHKINLQL